jgi:uncharacterized protein (TIGR00288 family)
MSMPFARAPHAGAAPALQVEAPNAALLIDFDNVTMGMRSDLSKELKTLLNSDIIKGKVTVQRAYADWRRYPQYIVPLSENSVDLIFAPAYGSSKKNATDIRMAIDGMELVFIRPEIGVFILLTGDSDFSSLVLKLKEYGKYVIGVGIQESSSDILVQNCDEYYSYTSLTGLRKTTDSANKPVDPWVLVEEAVKKMDSRNDVMRSDRLKQVMIEIDQSFNEGNFGFSKFSRFLSEAASRDLVELKKLENGQYEVRPRAGARSEGARGRSGVARRGEGREKAKTEKAPQVRGRTQEKPVPQGGQKEKSEDEAKKAAPQGGQPASGEPLQDAYGLMKKALNLLAEGNGGAPVRDSDLKRKMLELESGFNESDLGFGKFSRFLRQAHDHEIVDLEKREEGTYQVTLREGGSAKATTAVEATVPASPPDLEPAPTPTASPPDSEPAPTPTARRQAGAKGLGPRRGERRGPKGEDTPPPFLVGQVVPVPGRIPQKKVVIETQTAAPVDGGVPLGELGLPSGRAAVIRYLTNSYKGVGQKTAESLVDAFQGELFRVLHEEPGKVSDVVSGKRAEQLLEGWKIDYQRRQERAEKEVEVEVKVEVKVEEPVTEEKGGEAQTEMAMAEDASKKKAPPRRRTRGGSRGRGR